MSCVTDVKRLSFEILVLHRALVCAAIALAAVIVPGGTAAPAAAENLVENPGFDTEADDWTPRHATVITWSPTDQLGSPASGSMMYTSPNTGGLTEIGASRCLPASAGTTYAFGMGVFIVPDPDLVEPRAYLSLVWSPTPHCGDPVISFELSNVDVTAVGVWGTAQGWDTAPPGTLSARLILRVVAENAGPAFQANVDNAFLLEDASCGPSPNFLCLNQGRFRVGVEWETKTGEVGFGQAVQLTDDSGYFWFFNSDNIELVTKLHNACPTQFDRFWFFAAGLTDVRTIIRVHDTQADVERVYQNPQQTAFQPVQDTNAFATCP